MSQIPIRRALVSVYDKTGLDDLVRGLHDAGVALVSTGGSAARIEALGIPVTKVEDLTGFPECLDGRVKTLHPQVHAGILADRRLDSHVQQLAELGIEPFDLVVSNLYPFRQTVASGATPRRVRRADRHRRAVDGARRGQEPPVGRHRHLAGARTTTCWPPSPPAGSRSSSGSGWPPRRSRTPRRTTWRWRPGWASVLRRRPRASPASRSSAARRSTKVADAALRREPAPARRAVRRRLRRAGRAPSSCTARRCPTTTTSTPTPRAGPPTTSPSRPSRSSSTPTRAASPSAPTSPRRTGGRTRATRSRRSAA